MLCENKVSETTTLSHNNQVCHISHQSLSPFSPSSFLQQLLLYYQQILYQKSSRSDFSCTVPTLSPTQEAMKVLLIGATGNLGLRLTAALLTHGHNVVAFVRSSQKLESLLPASVFQQITIVQGSATDSGAVKKAILDANCDAVVNTAGVAALPPWGKSDLPAIFRSVLEAVKEAGAERKKPLRTWFMAGLGILYYPGSETMLSN